MGSYALSTETLDGLYDLYGRYFVRERHLSAVTELHDAHNVLRDRVVQLENERQLLREQLSQAVAAFLDGQALVSLKEQEYRELADERLAREATESKLRQIAEILTSDKSSNGD
jgi:hypothetical protein